ncbi:hypothetical protein [uncultured Nocardioides sp.]|uniref:hypothetical protein n=1 Tax=uncultured Nocardioides sp. TaxID=198441 RepID=UPI002632953E|nr:hypothetical protein [uncultured Nocardioides sp.]
MRPTAPLASALFLRAVATGCSWGGEVQELPDGTQVLVSGPGGGGEDALTAGPLEVVDGCLGVGGLVVVWAHGTEVVDGEPAITLPDGERVALGDVVELGGGAHAYDELGGPAPRVPEECRGGGDIWVAAG